MKKVFMKAKIIGISGKKESGKDTTAKIIQLLTQRGKNLTSEPELIKEEYEFCKTNGLWSLPQENCIWEIKSYANNLKKAASILTGIPEKDFDKQGFKDEVSNKLTGTDAATPREFLLLLGEKLKLINPNILVNSLFSEYNDSCRWIIKDVRFKNELNEIRNRGGIIIRVSRWIDKELTRKEAFEYLYEGEEVFYINDKGFEEVVDNLDILKENFKFVAPKVFSEDVSETELDTSHFDHVLDNNSNIEHLITQIQHMLIKEAIIHA